MKLEESGGYMIIVGEHKPNMQEQAELLLAAHEEFRETLAALMPALDALGDDEAASFQNVCQDIRSLLDRVDEHDRREVELLQEALLSDEGGEGG
jgi:hypothetical protein